MPVAGIKEIIRKFLSSTFSLMITMIFILCIPSCIHNLTHNNKYTNFDETNNKTNNISTRNEDNMDKEVPTYLETLEVLRGILYCYNIVLACLLLYYISSKLSSKIGSYTLNFQMNLYKRLFFRNRDNEPAVPRGNRITWIEQETST